MLGVISYGIGNERCVDSKKAPLLRAGLRGQERPRYSCPSFSLGWAGEGVGRSIFLVHTFHAAAVAAASDRSFLLFRDLGD
jgi:hypothetical protein